VPVEHGGGLFHIELSVEVSPGGFDQTMDECHSGGDRLQCPIVGESLIFPHCRMHEGRKPRR